MNAAVIFGEEEKTGDPLRQASMATTDVSIVVPSGGAGADSEVPAPGSHMSAKSVAWKDVGEAVRISTGMPYACSFCSSFVVLRLGLLSACAESLGDYAVVLYAR